MKRTKKTGRSKPIPVSKSEQISTIIDILRSGQSTSVDEIGVAIGHSYRTVYRLLDELIEEGFNIDKNRGYPRLISDDDGSIFLSEHETALIRVLAQSLPSGIEITRDMGDQLRKTFAPYFVADPKDLNNVANINLALAQRHRLLIRGYASSHSGTIADRLVEPVRWSANCRQLQAFDVDKQAMRVFVVSRMRGTTATNEPFRFAHLHRPLEEDCFWMTGETEIPMTLRMSLRALNLLHEEYPLSRQYAVTATDDPNFPYQTTLPLRSPFGVTRFLRGLPNDIMVD